MLRIGLLLFMGVLALVMLYAPRLYGLRSRPRFLIDKYMKQLLIEVDDAIFRKLERIAPGRARRRSAFIRAAIQKALAEEEEHATREAYRRIPDSADDAWFDPRVWEPKPPAYRGRRRRR